MEVQLRRFFLLKQGPKGDFKVKQLGKKSGVWQANVNLNQIR